MAKTTRIQRKHKTKFGVTPDDFERLSDAQNDVCAICKQRCKTYPNLTIDHDHETGKVRGLLCRSCNLKVEWFIDYHRATKQYLANPPADLVLEP